MGAAYLIAGCGYTGQRVARLLRSRGEHVVATTGDLPRTNRLLEEGVDVRAWRLPGGWIGTLPSPLRVLHSIPAIERDGRLADPTPEILSCLKPFAERFVYLSTTGVYGPAKVVDEHTPADGNTPREAVRLSGERAIANQAASWCVLRPAAIYGPDRGYHMALLRGSAQITGDGSSYISRIHVDDLAALAVAALDSDVTGAWPAADHEPCTQLEMAEFCCSLLGLPMPPRVTASESPETRRGDRRVDGRAICERLGVDLQYPTYREGLRPVLECLRAQRDRKAGPV